MAKKVLVIHGPNLNLLGEREPGVYGSTSFSELNQMLMDHAEQLGMECEIFQSNHEGAIIDKLHSARLVFDARRHCRQHGRLHPLQLCHPGCHS